MKSFTQFLIEFDASELGKIKGIIDEFNPDLDFKNNWMANHPYELSKLGVNLRPFQYEEDDERDHAVERPGFYPSPLEGREEFLAYLKNARGLKFIQKLGVGCASIAMAGSSKKYVLKYTDIPDDYAFINNVYKHQLWTKSKLFPVYHYVRKIDDRRFISVMEPIKTAYEIDKRAPSLETLMMMAVKCKTAEELASIYHQGAAKSVEWLINRGSSFEDILFFAHTINKMFNHGAPFDLHQNNYGVREDGTAVIFDPVFGGGGKSLAGQP